MDVREKWNMKNKKGYLKIHVAVNVESKKILSIKVTGEYVHDSKPLPELVDNIIKSDGMTTTAMGKLFGNVAYDNNEIFRYLTDNGILPCIKVRKNAKVRWKKGNFRNLSVLTPRSDLQKWMDSVSYGKRWTAETVFSCIKRMFDGEHVYSIRLKNMIQEMMSKASLYNKMILSI